MTVFPVTPIRQRQFIPPMAKNKWQSVERTATALAHSLEIADLEKQIRQLAEHVRNTESQLEIALR